MSNGYMIQCKRGSKIGYLDDGLLFTTNAEEAAILPARDAAKTAIKMAKQVACGAVGFCVVSSEFNFKPATKDLPNISNAT